MSTVWQQIEVPGCAKFPGGRAPASRRSQAIRTRAAAGMNFFAWTVVSLPCKSEARRDPVHEILNELNPQSPHPIPPL